MTDKSPIILVHGGWSNSGTWETVAGILRRMGHFVLAVDLPSHGKDAASPHSVGLSDYARRVSEIMAEHGPALLVGHSLGGVTISAGAELVPEKVRKLVYVAGILPQSGQSMLEIVKQQDAPGMLSAVLPPTQLGVSELDPALAADILFQDASHGQRVKGIALLDRQPAQVQTDQPTLTQDRFGRVPRVYVICENDQAVSPELQRKMIAGSPFTQAIPIDSGHYPQLTQPGALAEILTTL